MLALFGKDNGERVNSFAGPEQEYFLVDRNFYFARTDLLLAGRTMFGAKPAKGQEFEDHYFGAIPRRVLAFMLEAERELYKLGVPVRTRHNEVAPGQFELAPLYEQSNLATDHNQMVMTILKTVAKRYGMACLLHEKPFAGINGSGKHLNYSIGTKSLGSLFDPGENPARQRPVPGLLRRRHPRRAQVRPSAARHRATASNDHRLGANEAPPAIMSVYLGEQLADVFEQIKKGGAKSSKTRGCLEVGVDTLPPLPMDAGDRNRTSPFAFTGNRFEFRAVGSNQSIAGPQVALNTMLAESLDYMATALEKATKRRRQKLPAAVQKLLQTVIKEHETVIFNGDNYSEAWHKEAKKRGLPNLKTSVDALPVLTSPEVVKLFTTYGVFSASVSSSPARRYTSSSTAGPSTPRPPCA